MKLRSKFALLLGLAVLSTFGATYYVAYLFQEQMVLGQAERQARMLSRQILLTRRWVADHDGLFVIKKPGVENNPFLASSEIVDQKGQVYVKRNPALVTRELSDYAAQVDFCRFRVTSLRPVNPDNSPDSFERQSLLDFETGKQEAMEISPGEKGRTLRYMIPLKVEESCLPCHADHGYQVGNIRGGLSLEVPIAWADQAIARNSLYLLLIGLAATVATALAVFLLMDRKVAKRLSRLSEAVTEYPQHPLDPENLPSEPDEIGDLSRNLAELGRRLEKSQGELSRTREKMFHNEKMAAIGQLAAGIAHEVNNPLNGMRNCLKDLQESPDDREMRDHCLKLLDKGMMRIGHTVRQLLNFGRETQISPRETDLDALIKSCFELLSFHLNHIDLQLDLAIANRYRLDPEVLKQALINIGLNAVQAMPEGGTLTVTGREEAEWLVLTVTDTGHGIPPDHLGRIFEPFFTTKASGCATGLGLSVSFSLIKRMGGHIEVHSRPGDGSTFTITLPCETVS